MATFINFSEENEQKMKSCMETVTENFENILRENGESLTSLCQEVNYEPVVEHVTKVMGDLYDEVQGACEKKFQEWQDSNAGFKNQAKTLKAGEDAEMQAERMEEGLFDIQKTFWDRKPLGEPDELKVDTHKPLGDPDMLEFLIEIYEGARESIEEERDNAVRQIKEDDEDDTFSTMEIVINRFAKPMIDYFDQLAKDADGFVEETRQNMKQNRNNIAEEQEASKNR